MVHAIEVQGLHKTFGRSGTALKNVSFAIEPGEMVALIGASGSGKSTLIRHLAGLVLADAAFGGSSIQVLGRTVQQGGRIARGVRATRKDIGVVFQQFNLVGRLPVLTNVLVGLLGRIPSWRGCLGLFSREEKLNAMRALTRVGIGSTARQRASTLSGGQQQRAAIARALVQQAEVILADEPIASLDPASSRRVMETLTEINRDDGITILVSLHQVDYARLYCPRTIALKNGRVVYDGPSSALTASVLEELYGDALHELIGESEVGPEQNGRIVRLPQQSNGGPNTIAVAPQRPNARQRRAAPANDERSL